jgi:hypothetical protein
MNAQQAQLFRDLELLMLWYIPIGNAMPKQQAIQNLGDDLQKNLIEAMSVCDVALNTSEPSSRLELIGIMIFNLSKVSAIVSILHQYSKTKNDGHGPIISKLQFENYLERMSNIKRQIGHWKKKTASKNN